MKKKVLSLLLAGAMTAALFAGCGSGDDGADDAGSTTNKDDAGDTDDGGADSDEPIDYGSGEIKIWVPDAVQAVTQTMTDEFFEANPDMAGYTVTIEPMGEGEAAGNVITDLEAAPDIYAFAQDQMTRLVAANALAKISGDYAAFVSESNTEGAAGAAMVGDECYAFPLTADNGYFLYYDKSVITDPSSLEQIIADCEAAGKNFYFDTGAWYQTAFFFATGCTMSFDTDSEGNFTGVNVDYASENGLKALKAIINMTSSKIYMDDSTMGNMVNWAACVDGTWDSATAKDVLGDNYACAKLPTFTVDGETFQLSGFGGFKLMGIKPQEEAGKLVVCMELAKYLSDTDAQLTRYNEVGWGPSNLTAQQDEAVQSDPALTAFGEQLAFMVSQGQYPQEYWDEGDALGETICGGNFNGYSDEQLMEELQKFQDKMTAVVE